ncbi:MAG: M10 family metallopeptidase C-terminal domain-containing protein, partial [Candidatus Saccharibacteria bacterium]|nr:M10 family metallopeptidase C-terminal domain-containing protein [Pseudorhodobacter sp.]
DIMTGGGNADVFVFVAAAQSAVGSKRDQIVDFKAGIDKLDFSAFMAGGKFIGGSEFTAGNGPQIRYTAAGIVSGDVGGDGITDFQLNLLGAPILTAGDILF